MNYITCYYFLMMNASNLLNDIVMMIYVSVCFSIIYILSFCIRISTQRYMQPDLPNMTLDRDLEGFKEYFENPAFRSGKRRKICNLLLHSNIACLCVTILTFSSQIFELCTHLVLYFGLASSSFL